MPAMLKGKAKFKVPADAKPGDEVELEDVTFEANQDDYERSLRGRLDQQKRQHALDIEAKENELKELRGKEKPAQQAATDPALAQKLQELERQVAESKLQQRVDEALRKAGLADIPSVYRASIKLSTAATDAEVQDSIKTLSEDPDLKRLLKKEEPAEQQPANRQPAGRRGGGGSTDSKEKVASLTEKARIHAPQYFAMLANMETEQQLEVLESWASQGVLDPKK